MTSNKESFMKSLNYLMKEKKITQRQLGDFLGITNQTVSGYCTGKIYPSVEQVITMAEYFNISIDELLTGLKPENKEVRELTGLCENAIENIKNYGGIYSILNFLLSRVDFFEELEKAVEITIEYKTLAEYIFKKGDLTELQAEKLTNVGVYEATRILTDFLIYLFEIYRITTYKELQEKYEKIQEKNKSNN